jgi:hypothetical protein
MTYDRDDTVDGWGEGRLASRDRSVYCNRVGELLKREAAFIGSVSLK